MRTPVSRCTVAISSDGPPTPSELLIGPRPWPGTCTTVSAGMETIAPAFQMADGEESAQRHDAGHGHQRGGGDQRNPACASLPPGRADGGGIRRVLSISLVCWHDRCLLAGCF